MDDTQFLISDILGDGDPLETDHLPTSRVLKARHRRRMQKVAHEQALGEVMPEAPAPGEAVHVISAARWDFWTWVPVMVGWLGFARWLYCSTWTLSRPNAVEMFELWDAGKIGKAHFLTGTYFKRRETAVYTMLLEGIRARGGRFRALQNHAKVLLLDHPERGIYLTVEGFANLTANPRLEQYVITNDRKLWEFHRGWMEECFAAPGTKREVEPGKKPGFLHQRAGEGVAVATNGRGEVRRLMAWKMSPVEIADVTALMAEALIAVIRDRLPTLPPDAVVTTPPQGSTWPGPHMTERLAQAIAAQLDRPYRRTLCRADDGAIASAGDDLRGTLLVIDDQIKTGRTMRASLEALRQASTAYGFAYYAG